MMLFLGGKFLPPRNKRQEAWRQPGETEQGTGHVTASSKFVDDSLVSARFAGKKVLNLPPML